MKGIFKFSTGGESLPDNPTDDLNGVNSAGSLYSRSK